MFCLIAIDNLQAKRFTDAEKRLRAQQSLEKSQRTWLNLYKYNKTANLNADKPAVNVVQNTAPNTLPNKLPLKKPALPNGQDNTAVPDNQNTNLPKQNQQQLNPSTDGNSQPLKPSAGKKPGRVISKNPKEEKQKQER